MSVFNFCCFELLFELLFFNFFFQQLLLFWTSFLINESCIQVLLIIWSIYFEQIFSVPHYHPKSKPFVDHVMTFSIANNRIWLRNFQILEENAELAEIGNSYFYLMDCKFKSATKLKNTNSFEFLSSEFVKFIRLIVIHILSGPRMTLNPIRIFKGSFNGETLYQNPHFVTPNSVSLF